MKCVSKRPYISPHPKEVEKNGDMYQDNVNIF
jgi:hypothetical protein